MAKKFDKSAFIARFKEETNEHIARLEKDLLYLENNPQDEKLLEEMMREAHTLKGAATMMGYKRIADLAHKFEDALLQIKNGRITLEDSHFELLLQILDTINPLLEDKITWEDRGIAYPYVINLEDEINKKFGISAEGIEAALVPEEREVAEKAPREAVKAKKAAVPPEAMEIRRPLKPVTAVTEAAESIRVEVEKLNQLMNLVGELVIEKIRVDQHRSELDNFSAKVEDLTFKLFQIRHERIPLELVRNVRKEFDDILENFTKLTDELSFAVSQLQDRVMGVRMLPLDVIFRIFPRAVRDLSKTEQKLIEFNITGEDTKIDKAMIEKIQDPLMHILRNAVSHGIEAPQERKRLNKNEIGRIELRAYCKGSQVIIEVEDDGRGIDARKVKEVAVKKGILTQEEAKQMSDVQAFDLLFMPDVSTRNEVSQLSGRGVGLDVVRVNVVQLKGMIDINSELGEWTRFTIKLPLTLAVTLALLIKTHEEKFAVPLNNVEQVLRITRDDIRKVEKREAISVGDEIIPLVRLGEALEMKALKKKEERRYIPVVVVGVAEKKLALLVDELIGKLDVVAKNLGDHLIKVQNIAGATILGTGEVVLILDVPSLVLGASALPGLARPQPKAEEKDKLYHSILVVEDSFITRDLEKSILEAAGYRVGLAKDGIEALKRLGEEKFDLVVADIAMPEMDGIEMIKHMKKDNHLKDIPVIIVSAKMAEEDKKKGLEAGASAYILKSEFDQTKLLDTIERLIG